MFSDLLMNLLTINKSLWKKEAKKKLPRRDWEGLLWWNFKCQLHLTQPTRKMSTDPNGPRSEDGVAPNVKVSRWRLWNTPKRKGNGMNCAIITHTLLNVWNMTRALSAWNGSFERGDTNINVALLMSLIWSRLTWGNH